MTAYYHELIKETRGNTDILDLTPDVQEWIAAVGVYEGILSIFVPGSTGALTTIEYEPGLLQDLPELLEKLIPTNKSYHHDRTWHDGNGYAHLRAAMIGPGLTVPVHQGRLTLGTWQQIIFIDFDNRPRHRRIVLQLLAEK